MSAHFVHGDVKGVKQQDGSPRNTDPFFVMLGFEMVKNIWKSRHSQNQ
jgi:hypothetical protein